MQKRDLRYLDVFLNSGQTHLSFDGDGERHLVSDSTVFQETEQPLVARSIIQAYCRAIQESLGIATADLQARAERWKLEDSLKEIPDLMRELSSRTAARTFFNNKLSELEVVIAADSLPAVAALDRALLHRFIEEELGRAGNLIQRLGCHVFAGLEYAKVTLFDKKAVAEKILAGIKGGAVLALGDSAVDISFLTLRPRGIEYHPWWLGETAPLDGSDGLNFPSRPGIPGSLEVLSAFSRRHREGRHDLKAVIADIDSTICELSRPLCDEMVGLLQSLLESGVRLVLITGAGSLESCERRILKPLISETRNC